MVKIVVFLRPRLNLAIMVPSHNISDPGQYWRPITNLLRRKFTPSNKFFTMVISSSYYRTVQITVRDYIFVYKYFPIIQYVTYVVIWAITILLLEWNIFCDHIYSKNNFFLFLKRNIWISKMFILTTHQRIDSNIKPKER